MDVATQLIITGLAMLATPLIFCLGWWLRGIATRADLAQLDERLTEAEGDLGDLAEENARLRAELRDTHNDAARVAGELVTLRHQQRTAATTILPADVLASTQVIPINKPRHLRHGHRDHR